MNRVTAILLCAVVAAVMSPPVAAQDESHGVGEFTAPGTWTLPAGVTRITVELWGADGGGAGGATAVIGGGPGGGGGAGGSGAYVRTSLGVKPGETYTIDVGAPGRGGRGESRNGAEPGVDGGDTAIQRDSKILLLARGGRGGGAPKREARRSSGPCNSQVRLEAQGAQADTSGTAMRDSQVARARWSSAGEARRLQSPVRLRAGRAIQRGWKVTVAGDSGLASCVSAEGAADKRVAITPATSRLTRIHEARPF